MRARHALPILFVATGALACGKKPPAASTRPAYDGPINSRVSPAEARKKLAVTIYNGDFGLVHEVRDVELLKNGRTALALEGVAAHIQPETVHLRSLSGVEGALEVQEQNFRYDLLTPAKLLEKYVGRSVKIHRWNGVLGAEETVEAKVLSAESGHPVFEIGGEVTYGYPGRLSFPELPKNLVSKPTLVVVVGSTLDKQPIELSYSTWQMGWKSDYVLTVGADDTKADLTGWVTVDNRSGAAFPDAELKLVAGDVQKLTPVTVSTGEYEYADDAPKKADKKKEAFKEESLFEYHLYSLGRPTTLLQNEKKQITLFEAEGVPVKKQLVFTGAGYYYRGSYGAVSHNQKVSVFLELENKKEHHLGLPLPKGIVRVYKADASGAAQFIGEDRVDHTARDEKIRIKMGESFDVVGDRKQVSWKPFGYCESESDWEISLRNHKPVPESVRVVEPASGDWQVLSASHPAIKEDAHTFVFQVPVPANSEVKVTYRVRVKWC